MSSTYSTNLALELIGTGDQAGTWGSTTNNNLGTLVEQAISGYVTQTITDGADTVLTMTPGVSATARNIFIECTGALTAARNLIVPGTSPNANKKLYFIYNNTTGGNAVTVKVSGQTGVSVPNGAKILLVCNGTDIVVATNYMISPTFSSPTLTGTPVAPTAAPGTNTTQIATTAFVTAVAGSLGTMSTQNSNNVSITGGSMSGVTGTNSGMTVGNAVNLTTTNFTVQESGGKLIFKYGATTIASLDSSGNFTTTGNHVAGGTP